MNSHFLLNSVTTWIKLPYREAAKCKLIVITSAACIKVTVVKTSSQQRINTRIRMTTNAPSAHLCWPLTHWLDVLRHAQHFIFIVKAA